MREKKPKEWTFKEGLKDCMRIYIISLLIFGYVWSTFSYEGWVQAERRLQKEGLPIPTIEVAMSNTIWYAYGFNWSGEYRTAQTIATLYFNKTYNLTQGNLAVNWSNTKPLP